MEINGIEEKERPGTKIRFWPLLLIAEGLFQCPRRKASAFFRFRQHIILLFEIYIQTTVIFAILIVTGGCYSEYSSND